MPAPPEGTDPLLSVPEPQGGFFDNPGVNAWALPAALLLGWLLDRTGVGLIFLLVYHEMGHGIAAWLAGRWAFPLPFAGYTFWGQTHSWFVAAVVFAALAAGFIWAERARQYGLLVLCGAILVAAVNFNFFASAKQCEEWMIYGGSAGEIILTAMVILGFYYRLPDRLRWDFWRYPLLLTAACIFLYSAGFWFSVRKNPEMQIMGESLSQSRDSDADWVRLTREFGWTARSLDDSYCNLSGLCAAAIAAHYLWFLLVPGRKKSP